MAGLAAVCLCSEPQAAAQPLTTLYNFCPAGSCRDGFQPWGLSSDPAGNLYGVTMGTVYRLAPRGKFKVLYRFCRHQQCDDGVEAEAPLIMDVSGNLYGTTVIGGLYNYGVAFELSPTESGLPQAS
jgi:uncharacterized repeat protein (TIGR03803 family)